MTVKTRITLFIVGAGFFSSLLFSVVVFYELMEQPFELLDTLLKEEAYRTATMLVKAQKESDSVFLWIGIGLKFTMATPAKQFFSPIWQNR
jgi:hypothetical protein